jgi:hypothetical protein
LVRYIEKANGGIIIKNFRARFIEQEDDEGEKKNHKLVFIGIYSVLEFDARHTALKDVYVNG